MVVRSGQSTGALPFWMSPGTSGERRACEEERIVMQMEPLYCLIFPLGEVLDEC